MTVYYGDETKKALKNFPFSTHPTKMEFILAIVQIKKAAAIANFKAGNFGKEIQDAIVKVCDEILAGKLNNQFPLSSFQGGAGTAIHMNVNEVIANRATEILKTNPPASAMLKALRAGIHPNDHVKSEPIHQRCQSFGIENSGFLFASKFARQTFFTSGNFSSKSRRIQKYK